MEARCYADSIAIASAGKKRNNAGRRLWDALSCCFSVSVLHKKRYDCTDDRRPPWSSVVKETVCNDCTAVDSTDNKRHNAGQRTSSILAILCSNVEAERSSTEDKLNIARRSWKHFRNGYQLLDFHAAPEYMRDNEYILSHYRANFPLSHAFCSLFMLHNETLNIWTHLIGFFVFFGFTILAMIELPGMELQANLSMCLQGQNKSDHCLLQAVTEDVSRIMSPMLKTPTTKWPFFVFLGGSMFCLLASSMCHLLSCHSKNLAIFLMRMDYAGIATMIATSFFPPIYYVFQCAPIWQFFYLGTISLLGIATVWFLFAPAFQSGKYRPLRALLFLSMGISGILPIAHAALNHWNEHLWQITLAHEALMAVLYGIGTLFYVTRIPERWRPGLFDLAGHSHSIFHLLVIAGAYIHYKAALLFIEWRTKTTCE